MDETEWDALSEDEQASLDSAIRELFAQFAPIYGEGVVRKRLAHLAARCDGEGY